MTSRVSSSHILFVAAVILVVGLAIVVRLQRPETALPTKSVPATHDPAGTVPEFTSATFPDGELMKGLGPEWTYLRESALDESDARALPGLIPDRESVVKLVGEPVEMTLAEYEIEDQTKLDASLVKYPTSTVSGRSGWIVPLNDIAGGEGFLLKGSRSVLLISRGVAEWSTDLPSAIVSFIAAIRVP